MVEVLCEEPVAFTDGAILISGRFEVLEDDPTGMYYRMHSAEEVERYDDIRWTGQLPQQPQVPQSKGAGPQAGSRESDRSALSRARRDCPASRWRRPS
jgi:hypothetical protein